MTENNQRSAIRASRVRRLAALVVIGSLAATVASGCASGYPSPTGANRDEYRAAVAPRLTQPGIDASTEIPWQLNMTFDDDNKPHLFYVAEGKLVYGTVAEGSDWWYERVPVDGGEWDHHRGWRVDLMPLANSFDRVWYPQTHALLTKASKKSRPWMALASTLGHLKAAEAGSIEAYNRQFASVVHEVNAVERKLAELRDGQPGASDYAGRAESAVDDRARELARRVRADLSVRLAASSSELAKHVINRPDASVVSVDVTYEGTIPDELRAPATASLPDPEWVPASTLDEIARTVEATRAELDDWQNTLQAARAEREQRLQRFRDGLGADDFRVDLAFDRGAVDGVSANAELPDVRMTPSGPAVSGPVTVEVRDVDLARHFDRVGIEPREAVVRSGPSGGAARVGTLAGAEVGFAVERRADYTHVYDRSGDSVGWVRSSAVVSPGTASRAALERALSERRADGSPTNDALRALVLKQIATANASAPDWGGLVGEMSLESFEVIACGRAAGEPGYACDVRGRIRTTNPGILAMQRLGQMFGAKTGERGVLPYQQQLRVVYGRQDHWVIAESETLR